MSLSLPGTTSSELASAAQVQSGFAVHAAKVAPAAALKKVLREVIYNIYQSSICSLYGKCSLIRPRLNPHLFCNRARRSENQAVDKVSDDNDQDHHRQHLAHIVEIATHHQQLP